MKTEIGNTTKAFGREYNISVTNYSGDDIFKSYDILQENTIIVSSKVDSNLMDIGSYAVFMTDSNGYPVRLTYTLQPGNGLHVDHNDTDIMKMIIDENSIMEDGEELYVNKYNIIDNDTLTVNPSEGDNSKRGRIAVVTGNLQKATEMRYGIVKADEYTTYIDTPGVITVNTQHLETVDDEHNRDGIVRHSSEMSYTIKAIDGKLNVETQNLDKATSDKFGVVKTDDITIKADDNGKISVATEGLDKADKFRYGIVKGDEKTIDITEGIVTVNTMNLSPATSESLGVVMPDQYSLGVDDTGLLSVNRFSEIEALLETNNPEHAIFRDDIEDLKNRVAKLETAAQQELIEFLIPLNDPETVLPKPVFNPETKTTNHYSERKTISFHIKSNCKFNVNVEYKNNTNNYNQVTLISVKYGDSINIPANQLANTTFDETGQTVKTLDFTFAVKNYEKEDNFASINTQVIISAASINDAAIKQTSFHIFRCWNNFAYNEDDKPVMQMPNEPVLNSQSYWIYTPNTEQLILYGNSSKNVPIDTGETSTANFYFNLKQLATYMYYNTSDNTWKKYNDVNWTYVSAVSGSNVSIGCYEDADCTIPANFITASISLTYNTSKQYNALTVKTTKPISSQNRVAYIKVSVVEPIINTSNILSSVAANYQKVEKNGNETNSISTAYSNISSIKNELNTNAAISNALKYSRNVAEGKENQKMLSSAVSKNLFYDIVNNDITMFEKAYDNVKSFPKAPLDTTSEYIKYWENVNLMNTYGFKINEEYKAFISSYNTIANTINDNKDKNKELLYIYQENANAIQPVINVSSVISGNGTNGITFNFSRNKQSIVANQQYHVDIKYNFINKNGELVNSNGDNQNVTEYTVSLYPGNNTEYTYVQKNNDIISAGSGFTTGTTTEEIHYNVVAISGSYVDRKSLWGIGSGNKDSGLAYFGGWNPNNNSEIKAVADDVYLVFRFNGQDANKYSGQNYSFWTMPVRGKANGYEQNIVQANDGEFIGLSKTPYSNGSKTNISSTYVDINGTRYITKKMAGASANSCAQSAANEQRALINLAKTYYNSNNRILVADTKNIPVNIANNIIGIKIKSVTVSNGAFDMDPKITFSSSGSWSNNSSGSSSSSSSSSAIRTAGGTQYTFGNAKITNIMVYDWDDYEMRISFTITGGSTTNLPNNANVIEIARSSSASTNFVFIQDGKSYNFSNYYTQYEFSSTKWVNNSCTVTYRLYNNYSITQKGIYSTKVSFYNKSTRMLDSVYMGIIPIGIEKYYMNYYYDKYSTSPYLTNMTGLKFWIGITIGGSYNIAKRFESSISSLGTEISQKMPYAQMTSKNLNIVNALA